MITSRLALIIVRLILVGIGLVYGILKILEPEASPLIFATRDQSQTLATPFTTNRPFAVTIILITAVLAITLIFLTVKHLVRDLKLYGQPSPFSTPTEIAIMALYAMSGVYYATLNVLLGTPWFYSVSLAAMATVLAIYEGRQYSR